MVVETRFHRQRMVGCKERLEEQTLVLEFVHHSQMMMMLVLQSMELHDRFQRNSMIGKLG